MKIIVPVLASTLLSLGATIALASSDSVVDLYKQANCGCCLKWADHMQKNGFEVRTHEVADASVIRSKSGISAAQGSCHTAIVGGYAIEGHVPAADVRRLLKQRPNAVGLAVPGMPLGSPGMESDTKQPYEVLLVRTGGATEVFARH